MAKTAPAAKKPAARKTARKSAPKATKAAPKATYGMPGMDFTAVPGMDFGKMPKMSGMLTPEQAIDLYKANAAMALDIINAAIDGSARLRRKQFEGEEEIRSMGKKVARTASEARDPQSLMAAGQGVAQEALDRSMKYWGEMFDLIVEIQKRLFVLMEEQTEGMPGVKQAKAAMAMMPDLRGMQNVVSAMQGVVQSGGPAFESMQKVMADFAKMVPGLKR
jgi:hypothetical protein